MADVVIPSNEPGIAGFATESYESAAEPRYGEGPATTTHMDMKAPNAVLNLALYSVINVDATTGIVSLAQYDADENTAQYILAAPAHFTANQVMSLPVYREATWDMNALVWHSSFDTDAKKIHAFEGGPSPNIFIQKKKFSNSTIPA